MNKYNIINNYKGYLYNTTDSPHAPQRAAKPLNWLLHEADTVSVSQLHQVLHLNQTCRSASHYRTQPWDRHTLWCRKECQTLPSNVVIYLKVNRVISVPRRNCKCDQNYDYSIQHTHASYFCVFAHKKYSCSFITLRLNYWCHMDYYINVLTTFLGLERGSYIAVYAGSESSWISSKIS